MPSENWGRQVNELPEVKDKNQLKGVEHKVLTKDNMREYLKKKSMNELRDYAKERNLKAKDTSKSELINEIIQELNSIK